MDAIEMLKGRRSIRKYKDEVVPRELIEEVVEVSRFSPSWANYQVARYNFVSDEKLIAKIAEEGVNGFVYNKNTLKNAKNLLVLSFVKGKSGKLDPDKDEYATTKSKEWEMFDTGIACQTFCLAAYEKGLGTCIFGVIDEAAISDIVGLPKEETVASIIVFGYPDEHIESSPRKAVSEITTFR